MQGMPPLPKLSNFCDKDTMKEVNALLKMMGLDEKKLQEMIIAGEMTSDKMADKIGALPAEESKTQVELPYSSADLASENGGLNGTECDPSWSAPQVTVKSDKLARPDLPGRITKTEYKDDVQLFNNKIALLAKWMKESKNCVIYSGAGLSTASGINDIASKKKVQEVGNRLQLQPNQAHHIIAALYNKKYVKHLVNQNHDGLCQKAGLPLAALNEIHGSWFDKYNIVKMMDDKLDPKKLKQLHEWEEKSDLVIAVGTSLAGMNADSIAQLAGETQGKRLVIINNQETRLSSVSQMNIFCDISKTFTALSKKLGVPIVKNPKVYEPNEFIKK